MEAVGIAVFVGLRALAVAFGVGGFAVRIGVGCASREEAVGAARRGDEVQAVRRTVGGRGLDAVGAARPDEATGAVVATLRGLRETARGRGRGENTARGVVGRGRNDLGTGQRIDVGRGNAAAETIVGVGCADAVGTGRGDETVAAPFVLGSGAVGGAGGDHVAKIVERRGGPRDGLVAAGGVADLRFAEDFALAGAKFQFHVARRAEGNARVVCRAT